MTKRKNLAMTSISPHFAEVARGGFAMLKTFVIFKGNTQSIQNLNPRHIERVSPKYPKT
ncbi:hypothetical protein [Helicobacter sp. T3_23-1059]